MIDYTKSKFGHSVFQWCLLVLTLVAAEALAQTEKYELRFVQESVNCATRKVVFSTQIRATSGSNEFILGTSNLPFQYPGDSLTNPVLLSAVNYSGGRYDQLTMVPQGTTLTLNIVYQGTAPYNDTLNVTTDWTTIARIGFDVPSNARGCYNLSWSSFPAAELFEVVVFNNLASEVIVPQGTLNNLAGCAFAAALPTATIMGDTSIFFGEQGTIKVNFTGEKPVTLSVDGITYSNLSTSPLLINVFPDSTTTYTVTSVFNACGVGTTPGSAKVTVLNPTITTSAPGSTPVCAGSTVPIPFLNTDSFGPGNVFTVQLSDSTGTNFTDITTTGTTSPLLATIPSSTPAGSGYRVRVVSSNPVIIGDSSSTFSITGAPTATLSGTTTIAQGDSATLNILLTGKAPWSVLLTNNVVYTANTSPLQVKVSPADTTIYSLVTVSDACQDGTVLGSATVNVVPPSGVPTISTTVSPASPVCAGSSIQVPFTTTGTFGAGNIFTVQLSDSTGNNFVNIQTTGSASPLTATIPSSTSAGNGYRLRVVASAPAVLGAASAPISVSRSASATMTGDTTIVSGGTATLKVQFSGTGPWSVTLDNNAVYPSSTNPLFIQVSPTTTTTYTVSSATGTCGPGSFSGSVRVNVTTPPPVVCKPVCTPISYRIISR